VRFQHPAHPELGLRLGYGLNLYPSEDVDGVYAGLTSVALALRERLASGARAFGVGAWLPARAALELDRDARQGARWCEFLAASGLDAFTFNAFPYGGFHRAGLKERVFEPTWMEPERLEFTLAVARLAARARAVHGGSRDGQHLSISTHAGRFGDFSAGERERCAENLVNAALELARLERESGERVVLSIEPEPRSSANDTTALALLFAAARQRARGARPAEEAVERHLGACLDTCHAAVEFERPDEAYRRATADGTALGKLQFSSALALVAPDREDGGRERLLSLDEPTYLHQVTARRADELIRARDLSEVRARYSSGDPAWRDSAEWRCHFHVPVDLATPASLPLGRTPESAESGGLQTTRAEAEATLREALRAPERWRSRELHVEIETYTWNLFACARSRPDELVAGLEREWRHLLALLRAAGWHPVEALNAGSAAAR